MRKLLFILLVATSLCAQIGDKHPTTGKYAPIDEALWQRADYPLGSHFVGNDATFAVFAKNATRVLLEIYARPAGEEAQYEYWMQRGSDDVWRAKIADVDDVVYYGFRLWGPNWKFDSQWRRGNNILGFITDVDDNANRYNPNKVVFDPYSLEISHDKSNLAVLGSENAGMFGTGPGNYNGVVRRNFDTGKWAPKSILFRSTGTSPGKKPGIAQRDAVIYEAHVRGLTQHPSSSRLSVILAGIPGMEDVANVPPQYRGTYKGAGYMAKYLKAVGFNTIELLPIHETDNDGNPPDEPGGNYWGYMTYNFFAPDRRYSFDKSPGGPTREFKEMVRAFHEAGIEVYLDVVYNHTGEGGNWTAKGDTAEITCFRGLDNAEYYAIPAGAPHAYWESTGTGNNFDASTAVVRKMIVDSLHYWIHQMGVDGFRFDLATVLGRDKAPNYAFNANAQLLRDIGGIHGKTDAEMIAEAWDISTYQVGSFPFGWGEWNGHYRDAVRRFIKGGGAQTGFADCFNGSYNLYNDQGGPHKSVNFINAHDGFTMMDLVSYNSKNNQMPWPFGPSDGGSDNNDSWDHGGDQTLRRQQLRNLWTILVFSRGIPMAVWGDEFARTQNGNNNPYNVDSVATWNNYDMIATDSPALVPTGGSGSYHNNFGTDIHDDGHNTLFLFVRNLLHLRGAHPALRQSNYNIDYHFTKADGGNLQGFDRAMRIHIDGSAAGGSDFLLLLNFWVEKVDFTIPQNSGREWRRLVDTAAWAESRDNFWQPQQAAKIAGSYSAAPWSVVVLEEK